jgi:hypothetical protein
LSGDLFGLRSEGKEDTSEYKTKLEEYERNKAAIQMLDGVEEKIRYLIEHGYDAEIWESIFGSEALTAVEKFVAELENLNKEYE